MVPHLKTLVLLVLPTLRGRWFWGMALGGLELFGAHVAQRTVQSFTIVEHLDELEDGRLRLSAGLVVVDLQLALERGEEAFPGGIVITIAAARHGTQQAMFQQQLLIGAAGVLPAAIGMADQSRRRSPRIDRHPQRGAGQLAVDLPVHCPSDDAPAE